MFNVGGGEVLVLLLLALLVLGPERLPKAAGQAGKFIRDIRRMSSGFQQEIQRAMNIDDGDTPFRSGEGRLSGPDPGIADEVTVISPGPDDGTGSPPMAELDPGDVVDAELVEDAPADEPAVRTDGPPPRLPVADDADVTPLRARHDGDARAAG